MCACVCVQACTHTHTHVHDGNVAQDSVEFNLEGTEGASVE